MPTKIITVSATPPAQSSGADYNKGAPLNAVEFDQNIINLRAAVDSKMPLAGSADQAFTIGALTQSGTALLAQTSGTVLIGNSVAVSGAKLEVTGSASFTSSATATVHTATAALGFNSVLATDVKTYVNLQNSTGVFQCGVLAGGNAFVGSMTAGKNLSLYSVNAVNATLTNRCLGINVVPEAWNTNRSAMRVSETVALWGGDANYPYSAGLSNNAYYNTAGVASYIAANTANELLFPVHGGSKLTWRATSTVGVAGDPITFTNIFSVEKDKSFALQGATCVAGSGISFPATQVASTNPNTLDDYAEDTYTATATGMTTSPTGTVSYVKSGNMVTMNIDSIISGTSNSATFTLTGMPARCRPTAAKIVLVRISDNAGAYVVSRASIGSDGVITVSKDANGGGFTTSGTKAIGNGSFSYIV